MDIGPSHFNFRVEVIPTIIAIELVFTNEVVFFVTTFLQLPFVERLALQL